MDAQRFPHTSEEHSLSLGDFLVHSSDFPDRSFDLAIADPPYGASTTAQWRLPKGHSLPGFGGTWALADHEWDQISGLQGLRFALAWLSELKRLVKPEGSIWIHSTYHNSGIANVACQMLGLEIINEVVWYKRNAFPNLSARRLTASHETILWVHTGGAKNRQYRFNYEVAKAAGFEGDSLKQPGKQLRTVWDIPNNKARSELSKGKHPTQKPLRVAERLVFLSGLKGGKLLVPFVGSGSEMIAGIRGGMHATGFEIAEDYAEIAARRIDAEYEDRQKLSMQPALPFARGGSS